MVVAARGMMGPILDPPPGFLWSVSALLFLRVVSRLRHPKGAFKRVIGIFPSHWVFLPVTWLCPPIWFFWSVWGTSHDTFQRGRGHGLRSFALSFQCGVWGSGSGGLPRPRVWIRLFSLWYAGLSLWGALPPRLFSSTSSCFFFMNSSSSFRTRFDSRGLTIPPCGTRLSHPGFLC